VKPFILIITIAKTNATDLRQVVFSEGQVVKKAGPDALF
jgi:hypothetical protein